MTVSGDKRKFFSLCQYCAAAGEMVARLLCLQTSLPEQNGQPEPHDRLFTVAAQICGWPTGHLEQDHHALQPLCAVIIPLPR